MCLGGIALRGPEVDLGVPPTQPLLSPPAANVPDTPRRSARREIRGSLPLMAAGWRPAGLWRRRASSAAGDLWRLRDPLAPGREPERRRQATGGASRYLRGRRPGSGPSQRQVHGPSGIVPTPFPPSRRSSASRTAPWRGPAAARVAAERRYQLRPKAGPHHFHSSPRNEPSRRAHIPVRSCATVQPHG